MPRAIRIPDDLWAAMHARAREDGVTVSDVVRELARLWLAEEVWITEVNARR